MPSATLPKIDRQAIANGIVHWYPDTFAEYVSNGQFVPFNYQRFIARRIAKAIRKGNGRIIINVAPRHGKSELVSRWLPIWFLNNWPKRNVIVASYGAELAEKWGRDVRNEFATNPKLVTALRDDSTAVNRWNTLQGGGMMAVGVGGSVIGFGGNLCLEGDTLISTEVGNLRISDIYALKNPPQVLSWDHEKKCTRFCRIIGKKKSKSADIVRVTTVGGRSLRCTSGHEIYVEGTGYIKAGSLLSQSPLRVLQSSENPKHFVHRVFRGKKKRRHACTGMQDVSEVIFPAESPAFESTEKRIQRHLLQFPMLVRGSRHQKQAEVRNVRETGGKEDSSFLPKLQGLSKIKNSDTATEKVSDVWSGISANKLSNEVLQSALCERGTLYPHDRYREFSFQGSGVDRRNVPANAKIHSCPGSKCVLELSRQESTGEGIVSGATSVEPTYTPYGSEPREQQSDELGDALPKMPQEAPFDGGCGETDSVSNVEADSNGVEFVYDIEVEGCHNLFANGILVHNCLIDDPHKNWQEAKSALHRNRVKDWFGSTLYSRLEPNATVVLLMQRMDEDDLSGWLIENHPDPWEVIRLPVIAEANDPMGRLEGMPLCPERYTVDDLMRIKTATTATAWEAMYQQSPTSVSSGRAYHRFNAAANEDKTLVLRHDLPVHAAFDFNVNPGVHCIVGQYDTHADLFTAVHEVFGPRMKTPTAVDAVVKLVQAAGGNWKDIHVFGDRSGKTENTQTSITDYHTIKNRFEAGGLNVLLKVPNANPPIKDRLATFNDALCDSNGEVHYKVHPLNCPRLIRDLKMVREDENGLVDKESDSDLSHASDSDGYRVNWLRPIRQLKRTKGTVILM